MGRFKSEYLVFAAGVALLGGGLGSRPYLRPREMVRGVTIEPVGFDFGDVRQGRTLAHTFGLGNGSETAIEIVKAESSCSCTTTEGLDGRSVGPGGRIDVPARLKTGTDDGPRSGTITLYYRAAGHRDAPVGFVVARVVANVVPDYRVRPNLIDFGTIEDLRPVIRTIRVRPVALADVGITRIESTHEAVSARRIATPEGERDLLVELTFSGRSLWASGPVTSVVQLQTTSPGAPIAEILVRARFRAPVEVEPAAVVVGSGTPGRVEREIRVSAAKPVRIAAMTCPDPAVEPTSIGPPEGRAHRVRLALRDRAIRSELRLTIEPATREGADEARTLTIPIHRLAEGSDPR